MYLLKILQKQSVSVPGENPDGKNTTNTLDSSPGGNWVTPAKKMEKSNSCQILQIYGVTPVKFHSI